MMPGGDRTGPQGSGPRSGRGMGYCGSYEQAGFAQPYLPGRGGLGLSRRGAGRGWRHRYFATGIPGWVTPKTEQETADLKAQAGFLQAQLDAIQKRIEELETE